MSVEEVVIPDLEVIKESLEGWYYEHNRVRLCSVYEKIIQGGRPKYRHKYHCGACMQSCKNYWINYVKRQSE